MDWFWKSIGSSPAAKPTLDNSNPPSQSHPTPTTASSNPESKPLSRDDLADRELQSLLQELSADISPNKPVYTRSPRPDGDPSSPTISRKKTSSSSESLAEELLPTTMSCREAFDSAFYCQSLGGQFNSLYRTGTLKDCGPHWSKFWFCMKTRTYGSPQKEETIKGWYRKKEWDQYKGKKGQSSEDVWKGREEKLAWGEAFSQEEGKAGVEGSI